MTVWNEYPRDTMTPKKAALRWFVLGLGLLLLSAGAQGQSGEKSPLLTPEFWKTATATDPRLIVTLQSADLNVHNEIGLTPLHYAAALVSDPEVLRLLLRLGADVGIRDDTGLSPLHWAADLNSNPEIIRTLVQGGADVGVRDMFGQTPLHLAARHNSNPEVIKTLVQLGADVRVRDMFGQTPLHLAARYNSNPEVLMALLELGADPKARTIKGSTPWDLIQENKDLKGTKAYWQLNDLRW